MQVIEQKVTKRELILESAIEIFLEEGFVEASVERIAQHSGVAKQTVYSTFKNKRTLFESVVEVLTQRASLGQFNDEWLELPLADFLKNVAEVVLQQIHNRQFPRFLRLITKECRMFPELQKIYGETITKPWLDFVTKYFSRHKEYADTDPYAFAFCLRAALAAFAADCNLDESGTYYDANHMKVIEGLVRIVESGARFAAVGSESRPQEFRSDTSDEMQQIFSGDRRGMILDGALRAFLQSGFTSTSMDDVAVAADVSKQTVYGYFTDKKSLFETLSDDLLKHLREKLPAPEAKSDLGVFAESYLQQLSSPPIRDFIRVVLGESHKFHMTSNKYLMFLFSQYRPAVQNLLPSAASSPSSAAGAQPDPQNGAQTIGQNGKSVTIESMTFLGTLADYLVLRLIYSTSDYEDLPEDRLLTALFNLLSLR